MQDAGWQFRHWRSFWQSSDLPITHRAIFTVLLSLCDESMMCSPTTAELESMTGLSERTLRDHIDFLEFRGLLAKLPWRDKKGRNRIAYYVARILPVSQPSLQSSHPVNSAACPTGKIFRVATGKKQPLVTLESDQVSLNNILAFEAEKSKHCL